MSLTQTRETKEQAITRGFQAILDHIRHHGLTDHVAVIETWIGHVHDPLIRGEMARLLGFYWLRRQDTEKAVQYCDMAGALLPGNTEPVNNAMLALLQAGRWGDVVPRGRAAIAKFGEMFHWHNNLCTATAASASISKHAITVRAALNWKMPRSAAAWRITS